MSLAAMSLAAMSPATMSPVALSRLWEPLVQRPIMQLDPTSAATLNGPSAGPVAPAVDVDRPPHRALRPVVPGHVHGDTATRHPRRQPVLPGDHGGLRRYGRRHVVDLGTRRLRGYPVDRGGDPVLVGDVPPHHPFTGEGVAGGQSAHSRLPGRAGHPGVS